MSEDQRRRPLLAIALPLGALIAIAVVLWSMSRILLAASEAVAPVIALLFALNILIASALAATFRRRRSGVVAALAIAVLIPVLAAGVVGAVAGEREFHSLVEEGEGPVAGPTPEATEEPAEEPAEEPTEEPAEEPAEPSEGATEVTIVALNIAFDTDTIQLAANAEVTVTLDNQDAGVPHNWAMYTDESASQEIFIGEIITGPDTIDYTFTTPDPGDYYFRCDLHPNMQGTVTVG